MKGAVAVKRAGAPTPAHVQSNQTTSTEVITMNAHNTITNAIRKAIRSSRYPGPWVEWQEGQDMDKFLLGLMEKSAVPDTTAWVDVPSPFRAEQLQVRIGHRISTRYRDRIVCSHCAESLWSLVTTVHPSGSSLVWYFPWLIIGSMVKVIPSCSSMPVPGLP